MSSVSEASVLVRQMAEPRQVGDSVKAAIVRASRRLGFTYSRTKDLWYGAARKISAEEMDALRGKRSAKQSSDNVAAAVELATAINHLVQLRASMATVAPDINRPLITALNNALSALCCDLSS